ncbi:MAG TPA: hypothetical protein VF648_14175 [Pyrinomonadaceae bacterium]|jgi:hypothetical protein
MTASIYHFFKSLIEDKERLKLFPNLEKFPFDPGLLSFRRKGKFPDLCIKVCKNNELFTGGELIEVKDSEKYCVASFNSTIPTGRKNIVDVLGKNTKAYKDLIKADGGIFFEERDVFYLVRGRDGVNAKVALVHGSFFETIKPADLIAKAFAQVMEDNFERNRIEMDENFKQVIENFSLKQEDFSKVRHIKNASINLRFRIMSEAAPEGNILRYINSNTINLVLPSNDEQDNLNAARMEVVFNDANLFEINLINHPFNGNFFVFQQSL